MNINKRIARLEQWAKEQMQKELQAMTDEELNFYMWHGVRPQQVVGLSEPVRRVLAGHGLRVTVMLEPVK